MAVNNAMKGGVQGIKIRIAGRLGGAEMARVQQYKEAGFRFILSEQILTMVFLNQTQHLV